MPDGVLGRALTQAVAVATDRVLEEALSEAVRERRHVRRLIDGGGDVAVAAALDLKPSETADAIEREIFQGPNLPRGEWKSVAATLRSLGGNAASCGARLAAAAGAADDASALSLYLSAFFTGANEPRDDGGFGSAAARRAQPELFASLFAERERLLTLCDRLLSARARTRTGALLDLADAVIHRFEEQKRSRGALDYADLIDKTAAMFEAYEFELGALQARRRHRSCADRRGAGYEPGTVARDREAYGRILRGTGRPRETGSERFSLSATRSNRSSVFRAPIRTSSTA